MKGLRRAAPIGGDQSCACALSAEKKDREQSNSVYMVLMPVGVLCTQQKCEVRGWSYACAFLEKKGPRAIIRVPWCINAC